jgi:hypothetical protein
MTQERNFSQFPPYLIDLLRDIKTLSDSGEPLDYIIITKNHRTQKIESFSTLDDEDYREVLDSV